jgi:phytoene dehydrogenase-like protein
MAVHLPQSDPLILMGDQSRWDDRRHAFGDRSEVFFRWQEQTADALWDFALRLPAWPPGTVTEAVQLFRDGLSWSGRDVRASRLPGLALDAFRPVAAHLPAGLEQRALERLRLFLDAQLLISAQADSRSANALYGASALDLPRRGVVHLEGGMGAIAQTLVQALRDHGGSIHYRQEAVRVRFERGRPAAVETRRGEVFPADRVIFNLPAWNILPLLGDHLPGALRWLPPYPAGGWGAFVVYIGLDGRAVPAGFPLHHQIVAGRPLAEGNSVFLSLSPEWDHTRAPASRRALTLSTHTGFLSWQQLFRQDRQAYEARKETYTRRVIAAAERALPGLSDAAEIILPGTPLTFERFTRRASGWVGGFPQTSLFRFSGPRLSLGLWMVGDSIFPGQSVPAVALGGLRVARSVISERKGDNHENRHYRIGDGRVDRSLCHDHAWGWTRDCDRRPEQAARPGRG